MGTYTCGVSGTYFRKAAVSHQATLALVTVRTSDKKSERLSPFFVCVCGGGGGLLKKNERLDRSREGIH